jgi:hypothetical protein
VVQRFEARLALVEDQQESLREHYDRLYTLNVNAISELRADLESLKQLVFDRRLPPFPRAVDIREANIPDEEIPAFSWHQQLRRKQVTLPKASALGLLLALLVELLRLIAEGRISVH